MENDQRKKEMEKPEEIEQKFVSKQDKLGKIVLTQEKKNKIDGFEIVS